MVTNKTSCQQLWARNKYLVLSHSAAIYKEIREYLKQEEISLAQVRDYIQAALALPEDRGQVINAYQHVWGYFKRKATAAEKADFFFHMAQYEAGRVGQDVLREDVVRLLDLYPNKYLENSTLLNGRPPFESSKQNSN